jgi:hypothetical protein
MLGNKLDRNLEDNNSRSRYVPAYYVRTSVASTLDHPYRIQVHA